MGKTKKKPKPAVVAANDPTPERLRRDAFDTVPAPRMHDEQIGRDRLATTRRQAGRIGLMERDRWIDRGQAAALERYELLTEQAAYGGTRSCIDMGVRGGSGPESIVDALAVSRLKLLDARKSVDDIVSLIFVDTVLAPYGTETRGDVVDRLLRGRVDEARLRVQAVADALAVHFGIDGPRT